MNFRLSGMCKHVAALLYKVADCVELGMNRACTSRLQTWHQPSKTLKKSAFMEDIKTPKAKPDMSVKVKKRRDLYDPRTAEHQRIKSLGDYNLDTLSTVTNGSAAVLLYASNFRHEQPLTQPPDVSFFCQTVEVTSSSPFKCSTVESAFSLRTDLESFMEELTVTEPSQEWLAAMTVEQSESPLWHEQRKGRMTASFMGKIASHVNDHDEIVGSVYSLTASMLGYYKKLDDLHLPSSLKWGRLNEGKAVRMYHERESRNHSSLSTKRTGLWVSTDFPLIAASPDSLVDCECCGSGVVEVTDPWSHRKLTVSEFAKQPGSFLVHKDGEFALRKDHDYYYQVQTQMHCTDRSYCDFVTLTASQSDQLCILRVARDDEFLSNLIHKAHIYFTQVVFPEMKDRNIQKNVSRKYDSKSVV